MLHMLIMIFSFFIEGSVPPNKMVLTDRQFAEKAAREGYVPAFQEYLLPNAVIFDQDPSDLETWTEKRKNENGILSWNPSFSGGALAWDLGYTSGPWTYNPETGEPLYGHYVTVWKAQSDGSYKVILDIGIAHDKHKGAGELKGKAVKSCHVAGVADEETGYEEEKEKLFEADKAFSELIVKSGFTEAYEMCTDYELKSFRQGSFPIDGQIELMNRFREKTIRVIETEGWKVSGFDLSESREFGYTYGRMNAPSPEKENHHYYLRIWKKSYDGAWLVALEVIQ